MAVVCLHFPIDLLKFMIDEVNSWKPIGIGVLLGIVALCTTNVVLQRDLEILSKLIVQGLYASTFLYNVAIVLCTLLWLLVPVLYYYLDNFI